MLSVAGAREGELALLEDFTARIPGVFDYSIS
jgi:hypothetical protein